MNKTVIVLLGVLLLLAGCGGEGAAQPADGKEPGTKAGSEAGTTTESPAPEPEPAPVMLGTQRYVSPCRLLPSEAVVRIYGNLGPYARFDQTVLEQGMTTAQMQEVSGTVRGSVRTRCLYSFDDRTETTLGVEVLQYVSPKAALAQWKDIKRAGTGFESRKMEREGVSPGLEFLIEWAKEHEAKAGGDPVKGLDPTVLYVAGRGAFTGVRGNLLITVDRKDYAGQAFEGKKIKGALQTARNVWREIYANADDPELDQTTVPSFWQQQDGWPEFLPICQIFDDEAMVAATGHPSIQVEDSSVPRDPNTRLERNTSPGSKAVSHECRRMAKKDRPNSPRGQYWHGNVDIAYAAPGDTGPALLEGFVMRRLFDEKRRDKYQLADLVKGKVLRATTVAGAESAYIFDYEKGDTHYGWLVANVGTHVFRLDATRSKRNFGSDPMPEARLVAGAERIVANIKAATESPEQSQND